jgi:hypothetical protein
MKKFILIIGLFAAVTIGASAAVTDTDTNLLKPEVASTNMPDNEISTNTDAGDKTKWDLTLGGGGIVDTHTGANQQSLDGSFSFDPFKQVRSLWIGASQSVGWKPWDAETDIDADYSIQVWGNLYFNPGWSAGIEYGDTQPIYKTGPEVQVQYYTSDDTYIYGDVNYNIQSRNSNNVTWELGFGFEF